MQVMVTVTKVDIDVGEIGIAPRVQLLEHCLELFDQIFLLE